MSSGAIDNLPASGSQDTGITIGKMSEETDVEQTNTDEDLTQTVSFGEGDSVCGIIKDIVKMERQEVISVESSGFEAVPWYHKGKTFLSRNRTAFILAPFLFCILMGCFIGFSVSRETILRSAAATALPRRLKTFTQEPITPDNSEVLLENLLRRDNSSCSRNLDVNLLFSNTNEIPPETFKQSVDFAIGLAKRLNISKHGDHLSAFTFAEHMRPFIFLDDNYDVANLTKHIEILAQKDRGLYLGNALREMLHYKNVARRKDAKSLLIIFVYDSPEDASEAICMSQILKKNMNIMAVVEGYFLRSVKYTKNKLTLTRSVNLIRVMSSDQRLYSVKTGLNKLLETIATIRDDAKCTPNVETLPQIVGKAVNFYPFIFNRCYRVVYPELTKLRKFAKNMYIKGQDEQMYPINVRFGRE